MKFSNEFIDLVSSMLSYDPTHRPSISEIMAHPWYNGETATFEHIQQEFAARKEMVDQEKEKERLEKEKKKQIQAQKNFIPLRAHRNAEELNQIVVDSQWTDIA